MNIIPYTGYFEELPEMPIYITRDFTSAIFSPKKHTVSTYRAQQRAAKKRKRSV